MSKLFLQHLKLKNFKAIRNLNNNIKFTPLTVFIGNNGSGKSSVIEALETIYFIAQVGIDEAMNYWHGFNFIWNQAVQHKEKNNLFTNPMTFNITGDFSDDKYNIKFDISPNRNNKYISIFNSNISFGTMKNNLNIGKMINKLKSITSKWQFLKLVPQDMTELLYKKHTLGTVKLKENGSNIAEYLDYISTVDPDTFKNITATMKHILPYIQEIRPDITSELDEKIYLNLIETGIEKSLPGWLLSTGTMRALAIISILKSPDSPKLLVIEEIENGLDPRTINLLVTEIKNYIEYKQGQVIITTHSPYFLDLLDLSHIILVERDKNNVPVFIRPSEQKELDKWAKEFNCGQLYTMGNFSRYNK